MPGGGTLPFSLGVKADGLIYVAGTLAQEGDIKAQTKSVLDQIGQTLTKSGSSLANVVAVHVYLKNAADAAAMTEVWRQSGPRTRRPARPSPPQLVSAAALDRDGGGRGSRTAASASSSRPPAGPPPTPTATPSRAGDTLFMSGLVSRNTKDNQPVEGDVTTQTKAVMATAGELLKAAGFGFEHVVTSRVYHHRRRRLPGDMNQDYTPSFPKNPPARATVVAGLPGPTYKVEMTMTAVSGAEAGVHDAGRRWHARQAEPDAEQRHQGRQPPLRLGHSRQQRREQGQHEAQTKEALARIERTLKAAGFCMDRPRRRDRLHHRHRQLPAE